MFVRYKRPKCKATCTCRIANLAARRKLNFGMYSPMSLYELSAKVIGRTFEIKSIPEDALPKTVWPDVRFAYEIDESHRALVCHEQLQYELLDELCVHDWRSEPYPLSVAARDALLDQDNLDFSNIVRDHISELCFDSNRFTRVAYAKIDEDADFAGVVHFPYYCGTCARIWGGRCWLTRQIYPVGVDDMYDELTSPVNWCDFCSVRLFAFEESDGFIAPFGTHSIVEL